MGILRCLFAFYKHESLQAVKREMPQAFSLLSCAPENSVGLFDKKVLVNVIDFVDCCEGETCTDEQRGYKPKNQKLIGDLGGIPHIGLLLPSPHKSCQTNSWRTLSHLTTVN